MGALNIKDENVAEKARRLARLKGKSITAAVAEALDESLDRATRDRMAERERRERNVDEILRRFRAKIPPAAPSYEEIMKEMYDDHGLPR